MRLSELISFVREIEGSPGPEEREGRDEPLVDEPNAIRVERPPVPPWVTDRTRNQPIRDRGGLLLQVEEEFSPTALPPDVRKPNPPIDSLAYYLPFHLYEGDWGIYVRESGVLVVASLLKGSALSPGDAAFIDSARDLLLAHESMHFQAEAACSRAEVIADCRLYKSYFDDGFAAAHEEALANASAFQRFRREPPVIQGRVASWMKTQGHGYRDFERWVGPAKFAAGCRRASQHMLKTVPGARERRREPAEFLFDSLRRFKAPIYDVFDVALASTLKPFPKAHGMRVVVHTREHPPPHIHIEIPPTQPFTKYEWPKLQPVRGSPVLSSSESRYLALYVAEYGPEIDAKVRAVYPHVAPWVAPSSPAA